MRAVVHLILSTGSIPGKRRRISHLELKVLLGPQRDIVINNDSTCPSRRGWQGPARCPFCSRWHRPWPSLPAGWRWFRTGTAVKRHTLCAGAAGLRHNLIGPAGTAGCRRRCEFGRRHAGSIRPPRHDWSTWLGGGGAAVEEGATPAGARKGDAAQR